ncbi:hypothetical protein [Caloranaerobacter ferrireducens]|uniref:hypothetical protein n=1 Tax=Caloranaerobacter ferrireducens TaxID=1323370 RepID=UPI00159F2EF6|nr:hypothetical protein [Caloranaerobacter ferrireducens]
MSKKIFRNLLTTTMKRKGDISMKKFNIVLSFVLILILFLETVNVYAYSDLDIKT